MADEKQSALLNLEEAVIRLLEEGENEFDLKNYVNGFIDDWQEEQDNESG